MTQSTAQMYFDVIQEMTDKATSMKDETSDIYWEEFSDRLFVFDKLRYSKRSSILKGP